MGFFISLGNSTHVLSLSAGLMACSLGLLYAARRTQTAASREVSVEFDQGYHALIQGLKTWTLIKRNVASGRSARHVNSIIDCLYDAIDSYESLAELPRGRIGAASRQRNSVSMSCDSLSGDSFFSYDEAETLSLIGDQLGDTLDSQHGGYDTPLELRDLPALTQTEEDRAATGQTSTHTVTPTRLSPETLALATAQSLAAEDEGVVVHGGVQLVESTGVDEAGADMVNDKLADIRQPAPQIVDYIEKDLLAMFEIHDEGQVTSHPTSDDHFYMEGLRAVAEKNVKARSSRANLMGCLSEDDFLAKVYCLRIAFSDLLSHPQASQYFRTNGEKIIRDVIQKGGGPAKEFSQQYHKMLKYVDSTESKQILSQLKYRNVVDVSFYDIVLDFIVLDAFEDLDNPPGTIMTVLNNSWIPNSMKETAVTKGIAAMISSKSVGMNENSFMGHFYKVTTLTTPTLALGFLGLNKELKPYCVVLKDILTNYMKEIFSLSHGKYQSRERLVKMLYANAIKTKTQAEIKLK